MRHHACMGGVGPHAVFLSSHHHHHIQVIIQNHMNGKFHGTKLFANCSISGKKFRGFNAHRVNRLSDDYVFG